MSRKTSKANETPTMRMWKREKAKDSGALLGVRMGDFVEFFSDDAVTVAGVLGIVLTHRAADADGVRVPMCGIPRGYPADRYIAQLKTAGHRVRVIGSRARGSSEVRPVSKAGLKQMMDDGTMARVAADLEERERIARLARELGEAWTRHDIADAKARRARWKSERTAADEHKRAALADVARIETDLAGLKPGNADDALALAVLLFDRIAAIDACCKSPDDERHHGQATTIAKSLVAFLMQETRKTPSALGMRSYFANGERELAH